jgi:LacI family transcriptional regulator
LEIFALTQKPHKSNKVTIFDVAKAAGVSFSTVSRVATNYKRVDPKTRAHVLAVMQQMGYVANQQARGLASGKSHIVGLITSGLGNQYIEEIIRSVDEEIYAAGYNLVIFTTHRQKAKEVEFVTNIARGMAGGLLIVVPLARESYLPMLSEENFPYVLVDEDRSTGQKSAVGITNRQGAYDAVHYLLELNHRRIAFITDIMELSTAVERLKGYKAALEEYGVPYDPALVMETNFESAQTQAMTDKLLTLAQPPTAILTSTDPVAFRVMELLRERGLEIPRDMSVIGFDDTPRASLVYPRLTSVRHPLHEMGQTAARMLLERMRDITLPAEHVQLATQLIIRDSCSPIGVANQTVGFAGDPIASPD